MSDIISIVLIIAGVILLIAGRKKQKNRALKIMGALMILTAIVFVAPDFVKGFKEGFMSVINS